MTANLFSSGPRSGQVRPEDGLTKLFILKLLSCASSLFLAPEPSPAWPVLPAPELVGHGPCPAHIHREHSCIPCQLTAHPVASRSLPFLVHAAPPHGPGSKKKTFLFWTLLQVFHLPAARAASFVPFCLRFQSASPCTKRASGKLRIKPRLPSSPFPAPEKANNLSVFFRFHISQFRCSFGWGGAWSSSAACQVSLARHRATYNTLSTKLELAPPALRFLAVLKFSLCLLFSLVCFSSFLFVLLVLRFGLGAQVKARAPSSCSSN